MGVGVWKSSGRIAGMGFSPPEPQGGTFRSGLLGSFPFKTFLFCSHATFTSTPSSKSKPGEEAFYYLLFF